MKLFKLIAALLISTSVLTSCGPNKPDNIQHDIKVTENGFKPGPTVNDAPVQVFDTTVLIKPTWGQANHFASKRGDNTTWVIIGIVLLSLLAVVIYGAASNVSWFPKVSPQALGAFMFVLAAGALYSFKGQSSNIMWNNDKWVPKAQFDKAIQETGTTQPIWDSLEQNCKIVFGPYDCFKK